MARFKNAPQVHEGKIIYGDNIVSEIVLLAIKEIPNVELDSDKANYFLRNNAIKVKKEKDDIHVEVSVKIHFSQSVSDMAFKIQEAVRHTVETMTEYHVANVNVNIVGVVFDDKIAEPAEPAEPNVETVQEG